MAKRTSFRNRKAGGSRRRFARSGSTRSRGVSRSRQQTVRLVIEAPPPTAAAPQPPEGFVARETKVRQF